jgi:hypothetical protein
MNFGAVAAWEKLPEMSPACPGKDAVLQLTAQTRQR